MKTEMVRILFSSRQDAKTAKFQFFLFSLGALCDFARVVVFFVTFVSFVVNKKDGVTDGT
jgi:hypothetical protein